MPGMLPCPVAELREFGRSCLLGDHRCCYLLPMTGGFGIVACHALASACSCSAYRYPRRHAVEDGARFMCRVFMFCYDLSVGQHVEAMRVLQLALAVRQPSSDMSLDACPAACRGTGSACRALSKPCACGLSARHSPMWRMLVAEGFLSCSKAPFPPLGLPNDMACVCKPVRQGALPIPFGCANRTHCGLPTWLVRKLRSCVRCLMQALPTSCNSPSCSLTFLWSPAGSYVT